MKTIQIIELDGRPAALVVGDQAIIAEHLSASERARVRAKALYAIEIQTGSRRGPYRDEDAERYAQRATARRDHAVGRRRRRR
jgi:hypothetical protein